MAKATALEKEQRIQKLMQWIIDGTPDYKLKNKIKTEFKVEGRQAERYMTEAFNRWKDKSDFEINTKRNQRIAELQNISQNLTAAYKKTPAGVRTMLAVKKEISKLEGIYPARKVEISGDPRNPIKVESKTDLTQLSDEVLKQIIAAQK